MQLDDFDADELLTEGENEDNSPELHAKIEKLTGDGTKKAHLTGMYKDWFLDYASYVIM